MIRKSLYFDSRKRCRALHRELPDCGLTGLDWIMENDVKIVELAELVYSKVSRRPVKWVLAVPNDSLIHSVKDLQGKRIATELQLRIHRSWLTSHAVEAKVEFSWGYRSKAARFADAIVEVTETGSSLLQTSADRRRAALDEHAPLHQQRAGLCRSVETAEDGRPGFDAAEPWRRKAKSVSK